MNFVQLAVQAATTVIGQASTFVSTAISSLVTAGVSSISTRGKVSKGSVLIRIKSYSTILASDVAKKIQSFLTTNIAIVRDMNPKAKVEIKRTKNTRVIQTQFAEQQGFDEFSNSLEELSSQIDSIVAIESTKSIEIIRKQMMAYPAEPMNSSYNRTFTLRHGWEVADTSFNLNVNIENTGRINAPFGERSTTISISNAVPYTKWVQQKSTQAKPHRGRWDTIEDVSYQESIELSNRIDDAIQRII